MCTFLDDGFDMYLRHSSDVCTCIICGYRWELAVLTLRVYKLEKLRCVSVLTYSCV